MARIALVSVKDCKQLALLREVLRERKVEPLVCDMRLGGAGAPLMSLGPAAARWSGHDFSDVAAVYIRGTAPNTLPAPPPVLNAASYCEYRAGFLVEQSFTAASRSFFASLAGMGKLVVNHLDAYADHDSKAQFYEKMRTQGFPVPESLTTNDPQRALAFVERYPEVVVKPSVGVGSTRVFASQDRERIEQIRLCPVLMQERIRGHTLRVNIVGDTVVLALRIAGSAETVDSRTAPRGFEYVELPQEEQARMVRANRALGLHYAAWDVIEAPGGRYVWLDCNPGAYILWTGVAFSRAVLEQLGAYLQGFAETRSVAEAAARVRAWRPS